jgi:HD-GYP domain-containing protein (c-di-GMP phosphodiesterase class II)
LKNGPLTDEEWDIMRQHPETARQLLNHIPFLQRALEIPYGHHEHWDGSGYPRHLRGEEIPLPARLFAFADVWDALRSDRPYRPAWPVEKVIAYIRERSGKQFDPNIAPVFEKIVQCKQS